MTKFQCDRSGFMLPMHKARKEWDGKIVSVDFFEERHPQDFAPEPRADVSVVPDMRARNVEYLTGEQGIIDGGGIIPVNHMAFMGGINQSGLEFANVEITAPPSFYPSLEALDYWCSTTGINCKYVRLPFAVERMFSDVDSEITTAFLSNYRDLVNVVLSYDKIPIIDMHSFGKYQKAGVNLRMGGGSFSASDWAEMWRKLANEFDYDARIEFDIMNEPDLTDLDATQWRDAVNGVISAIRGDGVGNYIHVEIQAASGVPYVFNLDRWYLLEGIIDSYNNWGLHCHMYFDAGFNGGGDLTVNSDVEGMRYFQRLAEFSRDFQRRVNPKFRIFLGELGGNIDTNGLLATQNVLQFVYQNRDVFKGWTWYYGGRAWGSTLTVRTDPPLNPDRRPTPFVQTMIDEIPYIGNSDDELYWDFGENKFSDHALEYLLCDRTTTGFFQDKAGIWKNFGIGQARYTNKGLLDELSATNLVPNTFLNTASGLNNVTIDTGKADFLGGTTGIEMTETGATSLPHYATFNSAGLVSVNNPMTFQYMYKQNHNLWSWIDITPTLNFADNPRISNPFAGDYFINSGEWKMHHTRGTISETFASVYRAKVGFQPDDTLALFSVPDSYTQTLGRKLNISCPMITQGVRTQSPIIGANTRDADKYSFDAKCSKYWGAENFSFKMRVGFLGESFANLFEPNDVRDFLLINDIVAIRKNLDASIGTDFVSTASTNIPYDIQTNFRVPRKIGINIDRRKGVFRFGIEGMPVVELTGTIPVITSMKLGGCGGIIDKMKFTKKPMANAEQFTKFIESF